MRLPGTRRATVKREWPISPACLLLVALLGLQLPASSVPTLAGPPQPPGESNTGVPAGTMLLPSGPLVVNDDGTIIEGLEVEGCIEVRAHRVTIRRTRIRCPDSFGIRVRDGSRATLVEDVEIDGLGLGSVGVTGSDLTLRRANIHSASDGVRIGSNSLYEGNFIHDLAIDEDSHNDGMQVTGPARNSTIRGNTINHVRHQTSAIIVKADLGPISELLIEGNWLNGGSYTLYAYSTSKHATENVTVRHNRFGRDHLYGPVAARNPRGLRWEGNVWDDTGRPVPPPRSAKLDPGSRPSPLDDEGAILRKLLEIALWLARRI